MRITLVTRIFLPEPAAASQRLGALCDALNERGDDVEVLTSRPPKGHGSLAARYRVGRWPVLRDRAGNVRGYLPYLSFDIPAFFRLLFSRRTDVVVVEPPPTTGAAVRLACGIRRIPYIYYAADVLSVAASATGAPRLVLRAVRLLERWVLQGAGRVLCVSDGVADAVRAIAPRADVDVVGHGVDGEVFHEEVDPLRPEVDAVYLGTANELHGADIFVDAIALLADRGVRPTVAFIGQGSQWNQLKEAAAGLPHVSFAPPVAADEAAARLRGSRAALASLRTDTDYSFAIPTKMYSALAVGTPVLVCGPEPLRTVVEDAGLGWFSSARVEDVADAIATATASPPSLQKRRTLAEWAASHVSARSVALRAIADIDAVAARAAEAGRPRGEE